MAQAGWEEDDSEYFNWSYPDTDMRIDLCAPEAMQPSWVKTTSCKLREGWRRHYFRQFMGGTRQDVEAIAGTKKTQSNDTTGHANRY